MPANSPGIQGAHFVIAGGAQQGHTREGLRLVCPLTATANADRLTGTTPGVASDSRVGSRNEAYPLTGFETGQQVLTDESSGRGSMLSTLAFTRSVVGHVVLPVSA